MIRHVRKEHLERSPIIKVWIEDPMTMPESLKKNGGLYLPKWDPYVVFALVKYLEMGEDAFFNSDDISKLHQQDPLFYIRIYKLAGSLA